MIRAMFKVSCYILLSVWCALNAMYLALNDIGGIIDPRLHSKAGWSIFWCLVLCAYLLGEYPVRTMKIWMQLPKRHQFRAPPPMP